MDNDEKKIPSLDELSAQMGDGMEDFDIFADTPKEEASTSEKEVNAEINSNIPNNKPEEPIEAEVIEDKIGTIESESFQENSIEKNIEEQSKDTEKKTISSPVILDDEEEIPQDQNSMVTVRPVKFQQFEPTEPNRTIKKNLDILQDVSMHITVELGRSISTIREVMEMTSGSVVELNKIAGEQVEIYANGKIVAKGEVIVIEDKFGVRVTSTNIVKTIE